LIARINSLLNQGERLRKKFSRVFTFEPSAITLPNKDALFLDKLIKTIEANISNEDFTVEQLQTNVGMSRMQLHRKVKALTNQSTSDFIRSIRLKRAAQILRQPGIQVAEAAYSSGFNHMSYFSKCFKEQFGVLPSEYGKQME
jgi:AraC-like DNA-binding protein